MKAKILSIGMDVQPGQNFRTTRGGKRILTTDPSFFFILVFTVNALDGVLPNEVLFCSGIPFPFIYFVDNRGFGTLRSTPVSFNKAVSIDTLVELELIPFLSGTCGGE